MFSSVLCRDDIGAYCRAFLVAMLAGEGDGRTGTGGGCRGMRSVGIKDLRGVGFDFFLKSKLYLCS